MENIIKRRLLNQRIFNPKSKTPAEVLLHLGAIQAQDFSGAKWSIGLRIRDSIEKDIDNALSSKKIVRTWLMRGTLHLAAAENIRWMLDLFSGRIISGRAGRYRGLELDNEVFKKSFDTISRAFQKEKIISRKGLLRVLENGGISAKNQRGIHILGRAALESLICYGPDIGKQDAFVFLDDWIPGSKNISKEESLAKLAESYFKSRGPATVKDFVWWSGLKVSEASIALELIKHELSKELIDGETYWINMASDGNIEIPDELYLLPGFDEYLLGYKDRKEVLNPEYSDRICPGGNGIFFPSVVVNGKTAGTWKRLIKKNKVFIKYSPFKAFSGTEKKAFEEKSILYGKYLGLEVELN
jgi:hypothetical protein